ncbi:MAG: sulfurtransferase TusA family protein [Aquificaceae bacterium]|nr:sulfurtransferase TusA family protein [Aquificaceae bacterium]MDW8236980.1 sulfurtransferase TusA family protein [Aquificaceae bacterium]
MATITPDKSLDTSGLNCPLPVLKTKKAMEGLQSGQILEVISTDPGAKADIPAFCNRTGHQLLETVEEGGKYIFYLRKK